MSEHGEQIAELERLINEGMRKHIGAGEPEWPIELAWTEGPIVSARIHKSGQTEIALRKSLDFIRCEFMVDVPSK